jgi:hypothetical protein
MSLPSVSEFDMIGIPPPAKTNGNSDISASFLYTRRYVPIGGSDQCQNRINIHNLIVNIMMKRVRTVN